MRPRGKERPKKEEEKTEKKVALEEKARSRKKTSLNSIFKL